MAEIREIEDLLSSTHTSSEIDRARIMMASAMPSAKSDDGNASLEAAAWMLVLGDEEMSGRIPGWVIETAAKEFMAGQHGRFFPKATEFVIVCKGIVARHRWAAIERRRLLDAKVVALVSHGEQTRRAEMVARLKAASPLFADPAPVEREIRHDDWSDRRAAVFERLASTLASEASE